MTDARPQCPRCGRFVGDAHDESPGFGDAGYHDPEGCHEYEADVDGVATFCDERCADLFHQRRTA